MRRSGPTSPTAEEIHRRLGITAVGERRAIEAAARLVDGRRIDAALGVIWQRRGWLLVATDRGVVLVRRPRIGRARDERFFWADLTAFEQHSVRVELTFGDRALKLVPALADEAAGLAAVARRHLNEEPSLSSPAPYAAAPAERPRSPLAGIPIPSGTSISVQADSSDTLEFTCDRGTVARLFPAHGRSNLALALGETAGERLALSVRKRSGGWIGVVETPRLFEPVAGYYPGHLPGGVIAFQHCSYKLRYRYVIGGWRLVDDSRHKLATLRVHASGEAVIDRVVADVHVSLDDETDLCALLIAVWVIHVDHWPGAGGGVGV